MAGWQINQIIWYFYQVLQIRTVLWNITKNQSFDTLDWFFLPVSLKVVIFVVIFLKKFKEVVVSKSHGYMILLLPYNGELQKLLYIW